MGITQSVEGLNRTDWPPLSKNAFCQQTAFQLELQTSTLTRVSRLTTHPDDFGCASIQDCMSQFLKLNCSYLYVQYLLVLFLWRTVTNTGGNPKKQVWVGREHETRKEGRSISESIMRGLLWAMAPWFYQDIWEMPWKLPVVVCSPEGWEVKYLSISSGTHQLGGASEVINNSVLLGFAFRLVGRMPTALRKVWGLTVEIHEAQYPGGDIYC